MLRNGSTIELDDNVTLTGGAIIQGNTPTNPLTNLVLSHLPTLEVLSAPSPLNDPHTTPPNAFYPHTLHHALPISEIIGGTITDNGTIVVAGASKIDGTDASHVALTGGAVSVEDTFELH